MKRLQSSSAVIIALLLTGQSFSVESPAFAADSQVVSLTGHVPRRLHSAVKLDRVAGNEPVTLSLAVRLDETLMHQTLDEIYGRTSSAKRPYLTSDEFAQRFNFAEHRQKLKDFATTNGFTVDSNDDLRSMLVKVSGTATSAEKAFNIQLYHYRATDGTIFRAHETEPTIPASLAPHLNAIFGLSTMKNVLHPHLRVAQVPHGGSQSHGLIGTGPGGALAPADVKSIYGLSSVSLTGSGQSVALFELDGYNLSDITTYQTHFGLTLPTLTNVLVDGATNVCSGDGCVEVTLDIDMILALSAGISTIYVYEGINPSGVVATYNQIASDNKAASVSTSWGLAENESDPSTISTENGIFERMAAQGQTIYAAAGDNGAYDDPNQPSTLEVDDPASQPFMTGVGGTSLSGTIPAHTETVWNDTEGAGGGGVSTIWTIPSYQVGIPGTVSHSFRNVPDISLNADPESGYAVYQGMWLQVGGTSAAAPLWAAFTALLDEQRAQGSSSSLGFANTSIYPLANSSAYASNFNDITSGNNLFYSADVGYDNATGWGSFIGGTLINSLATPTPPVINSGSPTNRTVGLGQPATFTVSASGAGLSYQWQRQPPGGGGFVDISGATHASYSTPPTTLADDQSQYRVSVTNLGGTETSNAATLTVNSNTNLGNVLIYPNPWDARKHVGNPMHFSGLPDGSTVKIFTISAHWVRTLTPSGGHADWDLNNDSGQAVASGYYLYLITDDIGDKITGKLAVIR